MWLSSLGLDYRAKGCFSKAIELFDQTYLLAEETEPPLAVIAKVRMGELLQQFDGFGSQTPEQEPAAGEVPADSTP